MPVLRKRVERRPTAGFRPVSTGPNPMTGVVQQSAAMMARQAAQLSQAMAVEAEDKAKAMAKAAVFSIGPDGMPVLPEGMTENMGRIARRTFDATIEDRYAQTLQTAIRAQINDAATANLYDLDGFLSDAEGRMGELAADVPEQFQGLFQQIWTGQMVDASAGIAHRTATEGFANATSEMQVLSSRALETINSHVLSGNVDAANQVLQHTINSIRSAPDHILRPHERERMIDDVVYETALIRLREDQKIGEMSADELSNLAQMLILGDDEELLSYFAAPGEDTGNPDLARRAASYVQSLMGEANRRQGAAEAAATENARYHAVANGYNGESAAEKDALDGLLTEMGGFEGVDLEGNPNGRRRQIEYQDWFNLDDEQLGRMIGQVKTSGIIPPSLQQAFATMERGNASPEMMAAGFELYRALRDAPNRAGDTIDMTGEMGERTLAIFGIADQLHFDGSPGQEAVQEALALIEGIDDEPWTDEHLAQRLNGDAGYKNPDIGFLESLGILSIRGGRATVTSENARTAMRDAAIPIIFEGVEALDHEKDDAMGVMELYLRTGHSWDEAISMTRQSVENRYQPSEYMDGRRSAYAPEKWYADPPADGIMQVLGDLSRQATAQGLSAAEMAAEGFYDPLGLIEGLVDFGGERGAATPFQLLVDQQLGGMLDQMPEELRREYETGNRMFLPGRDYKLTVEGRSTPPVYNAWMRGPNGTWVPLEGTIDIREEWAELRELDETAREAISRISRDRRAAAQGAAQNRMTWPEFEEIMRKGENPAFIETMKRLYGIED